MVVQSTKYDRSLVVDNYYQEDLAYQSHLDKINNANALKTDLKFFQNKDEQYIRIAFPESFESIQGDILFYRASDKEQDVEMRIRLDENNDFIIPIQSFSRGNWKMKIDWEGDATAFYKEINIEI